MRSTKTSLMILRRDGTMRPARGAERATFQPPRFPMLMRFDRGKTVPVKLSLKALRRCAEWLAVCPTERLAVVGPAIRGGSAAALTLARARAVCVNDLLLWLGASAGQLTYRDVSQWHRMGQRSIASDAEKGRIVELWRVPRSIRSASKPLNSSKKRASKRFQLAGGRRAARFSSSERRPTSHQYINSTAVGRRRPNSQGT